MRTPFVPIALASLLSLTACSSGGGGGKAALDTTSPTAAVPSGTAARTVAPSTVAPVTPASPGAQGVTATSSAAPLVVAPLTTKAPGKPAARRATAPGIYTLDASGTVTLGTPGTPQDASGTQTLTVSAPHGDVQHSTLHGDQGDTEQDLLVCDTGPYAASLKLTSAAFTKEFRPSPAVLLVPDPAKVGSGWTWSGTSTDGKTKANASNKIIRLEALTIGGRKVATAVLQTHLVLSGDVDYTADITTWWAPAYRLPVKDHTVGKGAYNNFPFKTDVTTVMRSVLPS